MARFEFFLLIMVNYSEDFALTTSKRDRFFVETFKRTASYVNLIFEMVAILLAIARAGNSDEQTHDTSSSNDVEVKYVDFLDVESFAKNGTHFFVMLTGHDCYHCNLVLEDMEAIKKALKEVVPPLLFLVVSFFCKVQILNDLKFVFCKKFCSFRRGVSPILTIRSKCVHQSLLGPTHYHPRWGGSQLRSKLNILKLQISIFHAVYLSTNSPTILHCEHIEQVREAVQTAFFSFCIIFMIPGG
ncbi:unnamed protein product [Cylicostephanus goldi]|uniref:Thioredoxin domain-containing protein n=1 Tax=Cylicostephanus goldi TaxID=71465 RepID=A0A3P7MJA8_CYLGO|nr:unnamed protein product [Cylicostephanus goldi]